MSDSVRPHRRLPTRLSRPWDSPGKNTGVGCHFLLQCRKVKSESEVPQSRLTLSNPMDCSLPSSSIHVIFQARVLEWGWAITSWKWSHSVQSCRTLCDSMDWSLSGSSVHGIFQARVLEWGAIAFSRGSAPPRDRTRVSCIVGRRFYRLSHQGSPGNKRKNRYIGLHQNLKFLCLKGHNREKRQPIEWKKIFVYSISNKRLISRICKELL